MKTSTSLKTIFALSLAGMLFAGYLSATKLFTGSCAFNESCPYFLGYPACWYGLGMFTALTVLAGFALLRKLSVSSARFGIRLVAIVGTLFAGSFVVDEILTWSTHPAYSLILPTCVYGLVFYIAVLVCALVRWNGGSEVQSST
ncbi:MAG: hypothetical protein NUV54_03260 [Candidatus Taylorbacteria bacterium]|nr:hypothetical protein [Candidatus Taylorbacteria bacterium]